MNPPQSWVFGVADNPQFIYFGLSVVENVFSDTFLRFNNAFFLLFFYVFTFAIAPRTINRERCLVYKFFRKSLL